MLYRFYMFEFKLSPWKFLISKINLADSLFLQQTFDILTCGYGLFYFYILVAPWTVEPIRIIIELSNSLA